MANLTRISSPSCNIKPLKGQEATTNRGLLKLCFSHFPVRLFQTKGSRCLLEVKRQYAIGVMQLIQMSNNGSFLQNLKQKEIKITSFRRSVVWAVDKIFVSAQVCLWECVNTKGRHLRWASWLICSCLIWITSRELKQIAADRVPVVWEPVPPLLRVRGMADCFSGSCRVSYIWKSLYFSNL